MYIFITYLYIHTILHTVYSFIKVIKKSYQSTVKEGGGSLPEVAVAVCTIFQLKPLICGGGGFLTIFRFLQTAQELSTLKVNTGSPL